MTEAARVTDDLYTAVTNANISLTDLAQSISYYTGVIDTSSNRYQAAKAMLDEGKATKSEAQSESETQLEKLRMLLRMLGKDTSSVDELLKLYEEDEEMAIRNLMGQLDEDGDRINCYGVAGMDITGRDPATIQKLIDIPEAARQDMFDTTLQEYIRFNGMGSGEPDRTGPPSLPAIS